MVREYDDHDYRTIAHWNESRGAQLPPKDCLPSFGLIVPGVACGFVILTDCNLAILEFYISNPESSKEDRNEALDAITLGLIKIAKEVGISNISATTDNEAIRIRAEKHGFVNHGKVHNLFLKG